MKSRREVWVDYVKAFACIQVVLGHFFQSMVKAGILPENDLYTWFNTTIYYFHVPLFFICSGYLYQKYSTMDSWSSWKQNAIKKAIILGIPYFVFSFVTWVLKTVFSGAVNNEIGSLLDTLVLHPTAPYWYLYVLFFMFALIPTAKGKKESYTLLFIALGLRGIKEVWGKTPIYQIYLISKISENLIWFILGMLFAISRTIKLKRLTLGVILGFIFIALSALLYRNENGWIALGLGMLACYSILMIVIDTKGSKVLDIAATYTMPVFLMHTLFAALMRTVLIRIGINSATVHLATGLAISFIGPVLAMKALQIIKLDWIVYPKQLLSKRK